VAPLFITVDPQRDTPQVLKDYLAPVDKRMTGLTGTPGQLQQVLQAYKAYAAAAPQEEHTHAGHEHDHHEHDHADAYQVDHSGYIYLMDRNGTFIELFPYNVDVAELTRAVQAALRS
jgi:protein SCO1/2